MHSIVPMTSRILTLSLPSSRFLVLRQWGCSSTRTPMPTPGWGLGAVAACSGDTERDVSPVAVPHLGSCLKWSCRAFAGASSSNAAVLWDCGSCRGTETLGKDKKGAWENSLGSAGQGAEVPKECRDTLGDTNPSLASASGLSTPLHLGAAGTSWVPWGDSAAPGQEM